MAAEDDKKTLPWYDLPFYRSLTEKILMFGAPRGVILANALVAVLFLMDFHFWQIIPICIVVHCGCIYVCKSDDQFFDALRSYISKKNYYST